MFNIFKSTALIVILLEIFNGEGSDFDKNDITLKLFDSLTVQLDCDDMEDLEIMNKILGLLCDGTESVSKYGRNNNTKEREAYNNKTITGDFTLVCRHAVITSDGILLSKEEFKRSDNETNSNVFPALAYHHNIDIINYPDENNNTFVSNHNDTETDSIYLTLECDNINVNITDKVEEPNKYTELHDFYPTLDCEEDNNVTHQKENIIKYHHNVHLSELSETEKAKNILKTKELRNNEENSTKLRLAVIVLTSAAACCVLLGLLYYGMRTRRLLGQTGTYRTYETFRHDTRFTELDVISDRVACV